MKFAQVERAVSESNTEFKWKEVFLRPFLIGFAFGAGCYAAKLVLNSPVMGGIMDMAERGARSKIKA